MPERRPTADDSRGAPRPPDSAAGAKGPTPRSSRGADARTDSGLRFSTQSGVTTTGRDGLSSSSGQAPGDPESVDAELSIPLRSTTSSSSSSSLWSEGDTRPPDQAERARRSPAAVIVGTAVAYAVVGLVALLVAIAPSYASPLYPSAGLAMAAALVFGRPALAGVFLGALAVNFSLGGPRGLDDLTALVAPLAIAGGASLQAWIGAVAVRRFVSQPLTLTEPSDIARFFIVASLVTLVSASVATLTLWLTGAVSTASAMVTFITWWSGDAIGVMIGAPIALTLIGVPRGAWASRRSTVGLAMALATTVMTLAIVQAERWNRDRDREIFEQQAETALRSLQMRVADAVQATDAAAALGDAQAMPGPDSLALLASEWLREPAAIESVGWYERSPRGAEESWALMSAAPASAPGLPAAGELGVAPLHADALARSRRGGTTVAVVQRPAEGPTRLHLVRSIGAAYRISEPNALAAPAASRHGAVGAVVTAVRLDRLVEPLLRELPAGTLLCIAGAAPRSPEDLRAPVLLFGSPACLNPPSSRRPAGAPVDRSLDTAGIGWQVSIRAPVQPSVGFGEANVWLLSMIGLVGNAMFGALMLTVTGRSRRISVAVKSRTAQLEAQIRERARTELALRDSEQRFRNILNTVPIGILYTDLNGQVRQANPKFCELLGYGADELASLRVQDFTDPDDWRTEAGLLGELIRGETAGYRLRKRYVAKDGRRIWVQSVVSALRDESGESRRIVGVAEDITEQLRLAESERARETAEAANRAKSDFLSRMSHELRTPLNAMLGFAQLLEMDQRSPLSPNQRPWVGQIQQAGWHLLEMINDVLDLSRIEAGTLRLQLQDIDLPEQVEASLALVSQEAQRRGLTITHTLDPAARRVRGDSTRVRQILTNLLTNAVKYNVERGSVRVMARALGERGLVEVVVADTGLGMTPEQMAQLFQPFNRLGRERSAREGTGIGLVISQRLAELMGGSLTARSVAGQGSAFMLRLPAAQDATAAAPLPTDETPSAHDYHRRKVLYIEDNATNIEVMRGILAQRPQVKLTVAMTGLDGLAALRAEPVDLLLLDLHLPDIEGLEVLRRMQEDPDLSRIPVVAVSADAMSSQIEATLAAGAHHYLTKPVSVSELLRVVDQVLDAADTAFG